MANALTSAHGRAQCSIGRHGCQHTSLLFDEREVVAAACSLIAKAKKRTSRGRKQDRPRVAGGRVRYEAKKTGKSKAAVRKAVKSRERW